MTERLLLMIWRESPYDDDADDHHDHQIFTTMAGYACYIMLLSILVTIINEPLFLPIGFSL